MKETDARQDPQLERYLLGNLPDEEIQQIEARLLAQPALFSRVETIEDDLVDRYVRDELSGEDRRRFEEHLLPADRIRRRVAFARSLHRFAEERSTDDAGVPRFDDPEVGITPFRRMREPRRPLTARLAWAACLVAVIGAGALALVNMRLQGDLQRALQGQEVATARAAAAEQQTTSLRDAVAQARGDGAETKALQAELAASRDRIATLEHRTEELEKAARPAEEPAATATEKAAPSKVLFLALATRGSEGPTVLELPAPNGVTLQLDLDRRHPDGTLTVTVLKGKTTVWRQSGLKPVVSGAEAMVPVTLPEPVLLPGSYRIEITAAGGESFEPIVHDLIVTR